LGGESELGNQRPPRSGRFGTGLGQQGDAKHLDQQQAGEGDVDQLRRCRKPLHSERREEYPDSLSLALGGGVGDSTARLVDVEHAGADGAYRPAGREALNDARGQECGEAMSIDEDSQRDQLAGDPCKKQRPASDVVGEPSAVKQRWRKAIA